MGKIKRNIIDENLWAGDLFPELVENKEGLEDRPKWNYDDWEEEGFLSREHYIEFVKGLEEESSEDDELWREFDELITPEKVVRKNMVVFLFYTDILIRHYGNCYGDAVKSLCFKIMKSFLLSPNKKLHNADFILWFGDYERQYCMGISKTRSKKVIDIFDTAFESLFGYLSFGEKYKGLYLIPRFRYNKGEIIEYTEDEFDCLDKVEWQDDEEGYGTDLVVKYRLWYDPIYPEIF